MRKLVALTVSIVALSIAAASGTVTSTALAKISSSKQEQIHYQLKRYYHADGYIKAIGKVARRTIYSPNPVTRNKWRKAVKWLIHVRADALSKLNALRAPARPPHYNEWLCIHSHEASWTDDGAPYWGGLQFGYSEWHTFGTPYTGVDTANLASPLQQMWAAERYYQSGAGFSPWPNTARMCGLL